MLDKFNNLTLCFTQCRCQEAACYSLLLIGCACYFPFMAMQAYYMTCEAQPIMSDP